MNNKRKFLNILDISSFVSLVIATILVVVFEFTGNTTVLKISVYMYEVCVLMLLVFVASKIYFVYKKEETKDEIFVLTKKQKVWLFVRFALTLLLFCLITVIIFYI